MAREGTRTRRRSARDRAVNITTGRPSRAASGAVCGSLESPPFPPTRQSPTSLRSALPASLQTPFRRPLRHPFEQHFRHLVDPTSVPERGNTSPLPLPALRSRLRTAGRLSITGHLPRCLHALTTRRARTPTPPNSRNSTSSPRAGGIRTASSLPCTGSTRSASAGSRRGRRSPGGVCWTSAAAAASSPRRWRRAARRCSASTSPRPPYRSRACTRSRAARRSSTVRSRPRTAPRRCRTASTSSPVSRCSSTCRTRPPWSPPAPAWSSPAGRRSSPR